MVTKAVVSHYYEGQGRLSAGLRGSDGAPQGLRPMGNVSELSLAISGDVTIIKRPVGGKLVDMEAYTRGTTVILTAKVESLTARNLAMLTHGAYGDERATSVTDAPVKGYFGALQPMTGMAPSNLVVGVAGTEIHLTPYSSDGVPWDYLPSSGGAGLVLNDGVDVAMDQLVTLTGATVTAASLPTPGVVRFTATLPDGLDASQRVVLLGFTDSALAPYLARAVSIAAVDTVNQTVDVVLGGITTAPSIAAGHLVFDGVGLTASYDSAAYSQYTAAVDLGGEFFLRFDGLNLVDDGAPVTVEISRVKLSPSSTRDLLTEEIATLELTGRVLYDRFRPFAPFYTEKFLSLTSDGVPDPSMGTAGFFKGWGGIPGGGSGSGAGSSDSCCTCEVIDDPNATRTASTPDVGQVIRGTDVDGLIITLPSVATAGWSDSPTIYALQGATGAVQFVGAPGVDFAPADSQQTRTQGSMIAVKMIAPDLWEAIGDLAYMLPACSVPANITGATAQPSPLVVEADGQVIVRRAGGLVSGALKAEEVVNTPSGGLASTTVQGAIDELRTLVVASGGTGDRWTKLLYWNHAVDGNVSGLVASVSGYTELLVYLFNVTMSSSGWRFMQVSCDGGSTYLGSGQYFAFDTNGVNQGAENSMVFHSTGSASARSGFLRMPLYDDATFSPVLSPTRSIPLYLITSKPAPITHIRIAGGTYTGGYVAVYAR